MRLKLIANEERSKRRKSLCVFFVEEEEEKCLCCNVREKKREWWNVCEWEEKWGKTGMREGKKIEWGKLMLDRNKGENVWGKKRV